mgnify:CR=1 FL=1
MTVTEASRDAAVEAAATATTSATPTGLAAVVGSGDPRTIGKLFVGTSLLFLVASGVAGALVDFELADAWRLVVIFALARAPLAALDAQSPDQLRGSTEAERLRELRQLLADIDGRSATAVELTMPKE